MFEKITDKIGYQYDYSLQNVVVKDADVEGLEKEVQIYTALVDKGFVVKYNELAGLIFENTGNAKQGNAVDFKSMTPIGDEYVSGLNGMLDGLNKADYPEIIVIISKLDEGVKAINEGIETENKDLLIKGYDLGQEVYELFYTWLVKPQL